MAVSADQTEAERVAQRVGHGRITVEISAAARPSMSPQCALSCTVKESGLKPQASNARRRSGSNPDRRASAAAAEKDGERTNEYHPVHLSLASDPTEARLRAALCSDRLTLAEPDDGCAISRVVRDVDGPQSKP